MKFGSLKSGGPDGTFVLIDRHLQKAATVPEEATTLQSVLENWSQLESTLEKHYNSLNNNELESFPTVIEELSSPLPRAYQWLDGSAYLSHVERVRKSRGAELPPSLLTDPLMYQGGSDRFLGPRDPILVRDQAWGTDFEAEIAVITGDVPMGVTPDAARSLIRLILLVNDVSLRSLIPAELAKGFGFLHGKPLSAFSPVAVTPDELGEVWDGGKLHLPLNTYINDKLFGHPNAGEDMQFDFPELISHAAKTRPLAAGTIIGSGTVSNKDASRGYCCILEQRVVEILEDEKPHTQFLGIGDRIKIEMLDGNGQSIFGSIEQVVELCRG